MKRWPVRLASTSPWTLSDKVRFEVRALNFANRSVSGGLTRREALLWLQQTREVAGRWRAHAL